MYGKKTNILGGVFNKPVIVGESSLLFELLGLTNGCGDFNDKPVKKYINPKQINIATGTVSNGSKVNTRAMLRCCDERNLYYIADNCEYPIISCYMRYLIKRKFFILF